MKIVRNAVLVMASIIALGLLAFIGNNYLITPNQILMPNSLQAATIINIFVLYLLPSFLIAAAYLSVSIYFKDKDFLATMLNVLPFVLLIATILAFDNVFGRASRNFDETAFVNYISLEGTAFVFPNLGRIWFFVTFISAMLAFIKYMLVPHKPGDEQLAKEETTNLSKSKLQNMLYYIASVFMPCIFLFDLYNRNHIENHLVFEHVLIFAGILAVIGVLAFLAFKLATKSPEGSLMLCVFSWVFFWLFETILETTRTLLDITSIQLLVGLALVLALLVRIFLKYGISLRKVNLVFKVLSVTIAVLFIFNLVPGASHEITLQRARAAGADGESAPFYIKRDFYIDDSLPIPDILWIHADGMMSLETVERFWGLNQEHLREEFAQRGFIVNPNTELNAASTFIALSALLSPAFYDSFLGERLSLAEARALYGLRHTILSTEMTQAGLEYDRDIRPYFELATAFSQRGYLINWREIGVDMTHHLELDVWQRFVLESEGLLALINLTTPLNTSLIVDRIDAETQNVENDFEPYAKFEMKSLGYTHFNGVWRFDPTLTERDYTAIHLYPLAFAHMASRLLHFVDLTLEENPDTIIVIQSDHGFHVGDTISHVQRLGYPDEMVLELIHSVFSAVRIPERYGGLDEPLAPLNISRELVNRFVGQNYDLLP